MSVTTTSANWQTALIRRLIWVSIIESLTITQSTGTLTAPVCLSEIDNRDNKVCAEAHTSASEGEPFRPSQSSLTCSKTSLRVSLQVTDTWEALVNDMLEACCYKTTHRHISMINLSVIVTVNSISTKIAYNCLTISRDSIEALSTLLTPAVVSSHDYLLLIRSRRVRRIVVMIMLVFSQSKYISRCVKMSNYMLLACDI